jgi:hypothetical protein
MKISVVMLGAILFASSMSPCHAGACSPEIDAVQARITAKLEADAASGPTGKESAAATEHRQPTPKSIAAAEERLGDISRNFVEDVGNAMARARSADLAGDEAGCEAALAVARKALGD